MTLSYLTRCILGKVLRPSGAWLVSYVNRRPIPSPVHPVSLSDGAAPSPDLRSGDQEMTTLLDTLFNEGAPVISGRPMAGVQLGRNRPLRYVQPYPGGGSRWRGSIDG